MVKIIQQQNKELYQCEECDFQYTDKEWAEKCEAWCKKHKSCNLEIIAHATQEKDALEKNESTLEEARFNNRLFYGLIGIAASLAFFLVLYWVLLLDSTITNVITNTYSTPLYFWPYVILTLGAIILFGVNISLLVYRWRKFGPPKLKTETGGGAGTLFGIAASACPVCGSTVLAVLGIAGGLSVFPFGGLELKALSVGLLALPIWLTRQDLKKLECGDATCSVARDASFHEEKDRPWFLGTFALVILFSVVGWNMAKAEPILGKLISVKSSTTNSISNTGYKIYDEVVAKVLPAKGFQSKIVLGNAIVKLVENGVIDKNKFEAIYKARGGLQDEFKDVLTKLSDKPILLTAQNANFYVNLLWPVGLGNYMASNKQSPVNGKNLFNFASTGGWNLGKEENGGAYFNKFKIVELTSEQETLVTKIAQNTYRPCCNNSTFFQDCNHGSALLGLLEIGASQGLTENELYREALAFNSFWFPSNYIETGLYFKAVKNIDWEKVDPKVALGKDFSSGSGSAKIQAEVAKIPNLIPPAPSGGGGSCGA
ncbi:MAG: hypothetical protein Q8R36_00160 [bacterium]|nr:hypothetical protein [bacterium]